MTDLKKGLWFLMNEEFVIWQYSRRFFDTSTALFEYILNPADE
jgi:hypothetical protein